ncbi:angiopoietin-related protein 2-like isoform X2 [Zeugodacus cucurbitae]|uniref:angiopoietin-related protein 2-like isoform X2 n=1 Tax=Zeugodacus cucurbitae TaxID=28588 RepID=UPI0005967C73|nr:angiopoietin-related protein 2-like isoform X2 [Zeugodacus cucurbitae]
MSRLFFLFLFSQVVFGVGGQSSNTCPVCACNCICNLLIEAVNDEDVQQSKSNNAIKASNNETQSLADRVSKPSNCLEAAANTMKSGIHHIQVGVSDVRVFCEEGVDFGGWIVIQRRQSNSVDFDRNWQNYKDGFGDLTGSFWIGLDNLHALTSSCEQELYIQMESIDGKKYYARYSSFLIGTESESYALQKLGGWWSNYCKVSHLNGQYGSYLSWEGINENLSFTQMMIRPTPKCFRQLLLRN